MRTNEKGNLIIILAVAVVVILIVVGFFFRNLIWEKIQEPPLASGDKQVEQLGVQSDSDEVASIEKDVNGTKVDDLDQGLTDAEKTVGEL